MSGNTLFTYYFSLSQSVSSGCSSKSCLLTKFHQEFLAICTLVFCFYRNYFSNDQLPPAAFAPQLQGILPIARRFLNAEELADALHPRYYGDIRYRPVEYPAPRPVPAPVPAPLPDPIPRSAFAPLPAFATRPAVIPRPASNQVPRPAPRPAEVPCPAPRPALQRPEPTQDVQEPQEPAAAAPTKPAVGPPSESDDESEPAGAAALRIRPNRQIEEKEELQLCWVSSCDSSGDSSSTDEDERGFNRELERNPAFAAAYARAEEERGNRGRFHARPGLGWSKRNTRRTEGSFAYCRSSSNRFSLTSGD